MGAATQTDPKRYLLLSKNLQIKDDGGELLQRGLQVFIMDMTCRDHAVRRILTAMIALTLVTNGSRNLMQEWVRVQRCGPGWLPPPD